MAVAPKSAPAATPTVTLKQMASQIATERGTPKKDVEGTLSRLIQVVSEHVKSGSKVRLDDLGVFQMKDLPARKGRNPGTGAVIDIAASKKVAFRVAKALKEAA